MLHAALVSRRDIRENTDEYGSALLLEAMACCSGSYTKVVLQEGSGLYQPNDLSTVVVDINGSYSAPDGRVGVFDKRDRQLMKIGKLPGSRLGTCQDCDLSRKKDLE